MLREERGDGLVIAALDGVDEAQVGGGESGGEEEQEDSGEKGKASGVRRRANRGQTDVSTRRRG
jgi:hypothetical protein